MIVCPSSHINLTLILLHHSLFHAAHPYAVLSQFCVFLRDSYICDQFTAIHPWVKAISLLVFPQGLALNASALVQCSTAPHNWGWYCSPMAVILHCFNHPTSPIYLLKFFTSVCLIIPKSLCPGQTKNKGARWTMDLVQFGIFSFTYKITGPMNTHCLKGQ